MAVKKNKINTLCEQALKLSDFFYKCIVELESLPWEIRVAFPGESQLRQSRATHPNLRCMLGVSVFP